MRSTLVIVGFLIVGSSNWGGAADFPYAKRLASMDEATRRGAAERLAKVAGADALKALMVLVTQDPDPRVRLAAGQSLRKRRGPLAKLVLGWLASCDPDANLRKAMRRYRLTIDDCRRQQMEPTPNLPLPAEASRLRLYLSFPHAKVRGGAVARLTNSSDDLIRSALWQMATTDPVWSIRRDALRATSKTFGKRFVGVLHFSMARDPDPRVRQAAVELLGHAKVPHAASWIAKSLFSERDARVRRSLLKALGGIGGEVGIGALARVALTHKDMDVRAEAIVALSALGANGNAKQATAMIRRMLALAANGPADAPAETTGQPSAPVAPSVQPAAESRPASEPAPAATKVAVAPQSPKQVAQPSGSPQTAAPSSAPALAPVAEKNVEPSANPRARLVALLTQTLDASAAARKRAVDALCELKQPRSYRALVRLLWFDNQSSVRLAVARCFATLDHPLVDIALSAGHPTEPDRRVVRALEQSQQLRAKRLEQTLAGLRSGDPAARLQAAQAMQPHPSEKIRQLITRIVVEDKSPEVRATLARILAQYGDLRAMTVLYAAVQKEKDAKARGQIIAVYKWLRDRHQRGKKDLALSRLLSQLHSSKPELQIQAAQSLGTLRSRRAFAPLKKAAQSKNAAVRSAAVIALATFGDVAILSRTARGEADAGLKKRFTAINGLRSAAKEKIIEALSSDDSERNRQGIAAAAIRNIPETVPWLVRLAFAALEENLRRAAANALVQYAHPLAQWTVRQASAHDSSKRLRQAMWSLAVFADSEAQ